MHVRALSPLHLCMWNMAVNLSQSSYPTITQDVILFNIARLLLNVYNHAYYSKYHAFLCWIRILMTNDSMTSMKKKLASVENQEGANVTAGIYMTRTTGIAVHVTGQRRYASQLLLQLHCRLALLLPWISFNQGSMFSQVRKPCMCAIITQLS